MKKLLFPAVAVAWFLLSGTSFAECFVSPYRFDPYISDNVSIHAMTSDGKCSHLYRPGEKTLFTSSSIVSAPHNGTLVKSKAFEFHYTAKGGFKGVDTYTIKVCGTQQGQSGCSNISYSLSVK